MFVVESCGSFIKDPKFYNYKYICMIISIVNELFEKLY